MIEVADIFRHHGPEYREKFGDRMPFCHRQAMQAIGIRYYHTERLKEKSLVDRQKWKYDEEDKTWYLESGLPDFK